MLNNTSYSLNAGLDWESVERLSGSARLLATKPRVLRTLGAAPNINQKNIQNVGELDLTGRYGITPRWGSTRATPTVRSTSRSRAMPTSEYRSNIGKVGLSYGGDGQLTVGLGLRYNWTDYPNYPQPFPSTSLGDNSLGKNIDFTANWVATGQSTLDLRLSLSDITYTYNTANDFPRLSTAASPGPQAHGQGRPRLDLYGAPSYGQLPRLQRRRDPRRQQQVRADDPLLRDLRRDRQDLVQRQPRRDQGLPVADGHHHRQHAVRQRPVRRRWDWA